MYRSTFLALAATAGLIGSTELGGSTAKAATILGVQVGPVSVAIGGPRPIYRRVYYPPVVVAPAPVVVAAPPVVVSAPPVVVVPRTYDVFYRGSPSQPWLLYGSFASGNRSRNVVIGLQAQGYQVYETAR